jgi:hypothetical protein
VLTYLAAFSSLCRALRRRGSGGPPSLQEGGPDAGTCPLCAARPSEPRQPLCSRCRTEQRRLFWIEAFGGGFCFAAVAALLYLLGRWYAG